MAHAERLLQILQRTGKKSAESTVAIRSIEHWLRHPSSPRTIELTDSFATTLLTPKPAAVKAAKAPTILIVDDELPMLEAMGEFARAFGYQVVTARSGDQGLFMAQLNPPDLVVLDLNLPGIDGLQVLRQLKSDLNLRVVPVLIVSGNDDQSKVVECIRAGAEDFLIKPVNPFLLRARIDSGLQRKRLHDLEQRYLEQLQDEQAKSEKLLLNILPGPIAERLKAGEHTIADSFPEVTVMFADVVGFTAFSAKVTPTVLINYLSQIFSAFDRLAALYGLEKIKTIGDAYMAVGGLPTPRADHAEAVASMALDMIDEIKCVSERNGTEFNLRIGINTGPVVAGVIGEKKFIYDLWGDTVNIASRMQSMGQSGTIQVTASTQARLKEFFILESRGSVEVKGKGSMQTYILTGRK